MNIKMKMRYHYISTRMSKFKRILFSTIEKNECNPLYQQTREAKSHTDRWKVSWLQTCHDFGKQQSPNL